MESTAKGREMADALASPMFLLSLVFLALLAGLVITWVDIPRVAELAQIDSSENPGNTSNISTSIEIANHANTIGKGLFVALLLLWPIFWIEYIAMARHARNEEGVRIIQLQRLFACLIPPLRLGAASFHWGNRIWLPSLSWQYPGRELSKSLEHVLGKRMLLVALLILPILLIEFAFKGLIQEYLWLRLVLHLATGFIWFAFTLEFIVMVGASDRKLDYIKRNWIDLAIILIPLISFLRTFRVLRLTRLAKVQKLARLSRVYRMRGLGAKALKALMMLGLVNRILRITPEKRLVKLRSELQLKEIEIEELRSEIAKTESQLT